MNTLTPMKRLMGQFRRVANVFDGKIIELSKSKPKYNPFSWRRNQESYSKGVKSDFIRIYGSTELEANVAFSFSFLDGEEFVVATERRRLEDGEFEFKVSYAYPIEEFKEKLNVFVRAIESEGFGGSVKHFNDKFVEVFMEKIINQDEKAEQIKVEFQEKFEEKDLELSQNVQKVETLSGNIAQLEKEAEALVTSDPLYAELKSLEEKAAKIRTELKTKENAHLESGNYTEMLNERNELKQKVSLDEYHLNNEKDNFVSSLPSYLAVGLKH